MIDVSGNEFVIHGIHFGLINENKLNRLNSVLSI